MEASGLRDAHLHLMAHGEASSAVDLSSVRSVDAALELIAARAADAPAGAWVRAMSARVEAWDEGRYPTSAELDEAAGGRPALVASFDFHSGSASGAALRAAGIGRDSADPEGGIVERDARGEPTGVVLEAAYKRVLAAVPAPDDDQALGYVRTAAEDLAGRGFVEVNEMMSPARLPGLLGRLEGEGALPIAVRLFATPDDLPAVLAHFREHGPSERIRMGGMKLFLDGSLNSRTAWMLGPYADPLEGHPRGTPMVSPEELDGYLALCQASHMDCATHAIGDAAVRMALDAYERIGSPTFRLRIEHAQFIDEADVGRFAALGVVASMQPCHLLADVEAIERLLPHRADRAFALRDLVDAASSAGADPGDLIELGSDAPVVPPEPRDNLQAAVRRGRVDSGTVGAGQAITESECWGLMRARG